jgi:RHS repeat-associated protein
VINADYREIAQDVEYDEYGNILNNSSAMFEPVLYAGGLYDFDTKLYRFGARDYDPTIGRWTSKDPIGFAGGDTNLYAYVGGNPMSYNDPSGWVRYNNSPPVTVPVEGQTKDALQCVETCLQKATGNPTLDLLVTGGAETKGHSKNSRHSKGEACDVAQEKFNKGLNNQNVFQCAKDCGFGAGQFETFPNNPNRDHWHLQLTPGNGVPGL